jgi:ribosomal protein S27E
MTTVETNPKCPGCGKRSTIYGMPYRIQLGSPVKGEHSDVDRVILVMCGECGTVVGVYQRYTVPILPSGPRS